jgi:hypothetical protein
MSFGFARRLCLVDWCVDSRFAPLQLPSARRKATAVKVTIDSSESLSDALRVVGAMYDVTLSVTDKAVSAPATATRRSPARAARKTRTSTTKKSTTAAPAAGNVQIRSWAVANGMTVSDRGRLPGRVVAAYREAHHS